MPMTIASWRTPSQFNTLTLKPGLVVDANRPGVEGVDLEAYAVQTHVVETVVAHGSGRLSSVPSFACAVT